MSEKAKSFFASLFLFGFFGIFLSIALIFDFIFIFKPAWQVWHAQGWIATPAVMKSAIIKTKTGTDSDGHKTTTRYLQVAYTYDYQGKRYRSTQFDFSYKNASSAKSLHSIVDSYQAGSTQTCYVNPSAPSESVLRISFRASYIQLITLVFNSIGISIILIVLAGNTFIQKIIYRILSSYMTIDPVFLTENAYDKKSDQNNSKGRLETPYLTWTRFIWNGGMATFFGIYGIAFWIVAATAGEGMYAGDKWVLLVQGMLAFLIVALNIRGGYKRYRLLAGVDSHPLLTETAIQQAEAALPEKGIPQGGLRIIGAILVLFALGGIWAACTNHIELSNGTPLWVGCSAFGIFGLAGVAMLFGKAQSTTNKVQDIRDASIATTFLMAILLTLFAAIPIWIGFGPGERQFSGSGAFLGAGVGRFVFGGAGLLTSVFALIVWKMFLSKIRKVLDEIHSGLFGVFIVFLILILTLVVWLILQNLKAIS